MGAGFALLTISAALLVITFLVVAAAAKTSGKDAFAAFSAVVAALSLMATIFFGVQAHEDTGLDAAASGSIPNPGPLLPDGSPEPDKPSPAAPPGSFAGDLRLSEPISTPPCDGSYVVFIGAADRPGEYERVVQDYLNMYQGSSYLLTESSCSSLRPRKDGNIIYSVFFGPYESLGDACAKRNQVGRDSYIRRLDNTTEVGKVFSC